MNATTDSKVLHSVRSDRKQAIVVQPVTIAKINTGKRARNARYAIFTHCQSRDKTINRDAYSNRVSLLL